VLQEHFDAMCTRGGFTHGGTFSHHPVAASAALAVVRILEQEKLVERVARLGPIFGEILGEHLGGLPWVGDIRGIGFLWGVELVEDRPSGTPFPRNRRVTEKVWQALFDKGVILYKSTGLAGLDGDALIAAPPFIMEEDDFRMVARVLSETLAEVLGTGR
jgi:adenosylmethionine-8-amino-7-oxononanoate aminotransferase